MSLEKLKKGVLICKIVAVISVIAVLAIMIAAANIENWNGTISTVLKVLSRALWACYLVSLLGIATFRQKISNKKTDDKMKGLEQEIELLKKK